MRESLKSFIWHW